MISLLLVSGCLGVPVVGSGVRIFPERRHVSHGEVSIRILEEKHSFSLEDRVRYYVAKKIPVTIGYKLNNQNRFIHTTLVPSQKMVKRFLEKLEDPSKVDFSTFLEDYTHQLEVCTKLVSRYYQVYNLCSCRVPNQYTLYLLHGIASKLEAIYDVLSNDDNASDPLGVKDKINMTERLRTLEEKQKSTWGGLRVVEYFFRVGARHMWTTILAITMRGFLYHDSLLSVGMWSGTALTAFSYGGYWALRHNNWESVVNLIHLAVIDGVICVTTLVFTSQRYYVVGLLASFWYYMTAFHVDYLIADPMKKVLARLQRKGVKVAMRLQKKENESTKAIYDIAKEEELFPAEIARIIISFLEPSVVVEKVFGEEINMMKDDYYKKAAILSGTVDRLSERITLYTGKVVVFFTFMMNLVAVSSYFFSSLGIIVKVLLLQNR